MHIIVLVYTFTLLQDVFMPWVIIFQDGMGKLHVTGDGVRLKGVAEFIEPLLTSNITSDEVKY